MAAAKLASRMEVAEKEEEEGPEGPRGDAPYGRRGP